MKKTIGLERAISIIWTDISRNAPARFESYRNPRDKSELDAIARHTWNISLCESLQPALHASELLLRNQVYQSMASLSGVDWLFDPEILEPNERSRVDRALRDIERDGQRPTPDRVVSRLGFGFWVNLFNAPYEDRVVRHVLADGFRGVKRGQDRNRRYLRGTYETILILRNRAFHLESIWNRDSLMQDFEKTWLAAQWISPTYAQSARLFCRFEEVFYSGFKETRAKILESIRERLSVFNENEI